MPMGIIPDDEFDSDVARVVTDVSDAKDKESVPTDNSPIGINGINGNEAAIARITEIRRGRPNGAKGISPDQREEIAKHAIEFGNASALANFPISQSSVSAYKTGRTSLADDEPDFSLLESVNRTKRKLMSKAANKLDEAINNITDDKLEGAKLRDLAAITTAMSAVIRNMEPEVNPNQNNPTVSFVFFAPKIKEENSFDIINVVE